MDIELRKFLGVEFVVNKTDNFLILTPNEMMIICHFEANVSISHINFIKFKSADNFEIFVYSNGDYTEVYIIKDGKYIPDESNKHQGYCFSEFKIFKSYVDYLKFIKKIDLLK
jgi:hypothetical protein